MKDSLLALIELAATSKMGEIREDLSVVDQHPELVAPLMRYDMLLRRKVEETIQEHIAGVNKATLAQCKAVYDRGYFMNLPIPYDGIQQLCQELLALCKKFSITPPEIWGKYADGIFDWEGDIEYMATL